MKKYFIAMILASALTSPVAMAENSSYGGLTIGQIDVDEDFDIDTGNIGIVLGSIFDYGLGMELFYSFSVIDHDETVNGIDFSADTDIAALYALYKTPGDIYLKAKAGYAWVNVKFSAEDGELGSADDSTAGFSYGLAGGWAVDKGAVELSYLWLPEFSEYDGVDVEGNIDMWNITFLWSF